MKIRLAYTALAALMISVGASSAAAQATLELRRAIDCTPGAPLLADPLSGNKLCFADDVVFDRSNIVGVEKIHTPYGIDAIRLTLDAKGAANMTAATSNVVPGQSRIGFIYNGKLVSAPIVMEAIAGNQVEVSGIGSDALDDAVADLRAGLPE